MFEWKEDWGDKSDRWTPQLRRELKVVDAEDGIFWMPFKEFIKFAQGISICYVMPHFKYNSTYIQQEDNVQTSLVRLGIPKRGHYCISVDQMDSKFFKKYGYSYSYFRIMIGRMTKGGGFVMIDGKLSCERNIFFNITDLNAGDYVVSVEAYWEDKSEALRTFTLSCYGEHMSDVTEYNIDKKSIEAVEYFLWKSMATHNQLGASFQNNGSFRVDGSSYQKQVCTDYGVGAQIFAFTNNEQGGDEAIYQQHNASRNGGLSTSSQPNTGEDLLLILNPGETEVFVYKMDPNYNDFKVKHKVSNEWLGELDSDYENGLIKSLNQTQVEQSGKNLKAIKSQIPQSYEQETLDRRDLANVYSHGGFAKKRDNGNDWMDRNRAVNNDRDQDTLDNCQCAIF